MYAKIISNRFLVLACLLLSLAWAQLPQAQSAQYPLLHNHEEFISSTTDPFVVSKTFGFDINWQDSWDHLTIHENVSSTLFPGGITGGIQLVRGDPDQQYSFVVLVRVSSSSKEALDFVSITNDAYTVYVDSTSSSQSLDPSEPAKVGIDIIIFVKPHVLQFGPTNIWTVNLDIDVWQDLDFETYHMKLSTVKGTVTGIESLLFTAHEISINTESGSISGNWSLPASISFDADSGNIDIDLVPKMWSSGPNTGGDLAAFANSGDITIRMPLETDKLSLRNGTTRVEACNGSIAGTFVHGAITSLIAYNSITVTLRPYWAFYTWGGIQHNFITTDARHGSTVVEILEPKIVPYYEINPLFFATSRHTQGTGPLNLVQRMKVTYPGEWGGTAVAHSSFGGLVDVSGDDFEEVEKNQTTIKVQRSPGAGILWFETDVGIAELHLRPCSSIECAYH
jgi:hypothetical protein